MNTDLVFHWISLCRSYDEAGLAIWFRFKVLSQFNFDLASRFRRRMYLS